MRGHWRYVVAASVAVLPTACSSASAGRAAPSPVFAGEGAAFALSAASGPKEQPLPADSASTKAASGPCVTPSPPSDVTLLDDFEDGDAAAFKGFQREGWWFAAADSTEGAKLSPERGAF